MLRRFIARLRALAHRICPHGMRSMGVVEDVRTCEQCGNVFTPRREHARFCSAACRVAWNQENTGDQEAGASALDWSITAMGEVMQQLGSGEARDRVQGFAVISETVWWVTLIDATLVRYHPQAYETALTAQAQAPAERRAIEGTFAGLRFVRNRMGFHADPVDFVQPQESRPGHDHGITAWTWKSLPEPGPRIACTARADMGDKAVPGV